MPRQFLPKKSSVHRIACTALYRACLSQCASIPLPPELLTRGRSNPLAHLIRKKFRQNVDVTSSAQVVRALETGYACEQLLRHAASGDTIAKTQVIDLLTILHDEYLHAKAVTPKPIPRPRPPIPERYSGAPRLLHVRPRPEGTLTARRRVPTMGFVSNGTVGFLMTKKPQSAFLSRVLKQKDTQRRAWLRRSAEYEHNSDMGLLEDRWDEDMGSELDVEGIESKGEGVVVSWGREYKRQADELNRTRMDEFTRTSRTGRRMMEIVWEERELAKKERAKRKHERNERKWKDEGGGQNGRKLVGRL
ncbi:hypothetical protein BJ875DRAFT_471895 [Amylocarpus encephaloides]|uniref:Uncharacterized protein n=1 Tax=Amylocarpus encephaloides TaxID=45428 RepID=A0A9P8C1K8_9HELO|nr:hypothetical protein BJ875DRAFT_471895 [Amylocarpus encephaloides]